MEFKLIHWFLDPFRHMRSFTIALLLFDDHIVCKRTSVRTIVLAEGVMDLMVFIGLHNPAFRYCHPMGIPPKISYYLSWPGKTLFAIYHPIFFVEFIFKPRRRYQFNFY